MFNAQEIYDDLRDADMDDAQARALVEVLKMTRYSSPKALDTETMRDILRGGGFDEKKTRVLIKMQVAAHKKIHGRTANA